MIKVFRNPELPPAQPGQQCLLSWFVQVPPNLPVGELQVELTTNENLGGIEVLPGQTYPLYAGQVTAGRPVPVKTPLKVHKPGHYAVGLKASVAVATWGRMEFLSEGTLTLHVKEAAGQLDLSIESQGSVLVDAEQLHRVRSMNIKAGGPVLVDLSTLPMLNNRLDAAQQVEFERFQLEHQQHELPMFATAVHAPDLDLFWACWQRWFPQAHPLNELTLRSAEGSKTDDHGRFMHDGVKIDTALVDQEVYLRLMTQHRAQPSRLLLLQQSTEGHFMQVAPTPHGDDCLWPMKPRRFPGDFLGNLAEDPAMQPISLWYDAPGEERFLAVVTNAALVEPWEALSEADNPGDPLSKRKMRPHHVSAVLNAIWNHRLALQAQPPSADPSAEMEIGYLQIQVQPG